MYGTEKFHFIDRSSKLVYVVQEGVLESVKLIRKDSDGGIDEYPF